MLTTAMHNTVYEDFALAVSPASSNHDRSGGRSHQAYQVEAEVIIGRLGNVLIASVRTVLVLYMDIRHWPSI